MATVCRIKKLDENVINKIAAGEIIQRPANAVKELLENSLDAGSTQIIISIKQGGLGVLQIQDNGSGICEEDFPILCEKFTTSKLQEFHDLLSISTFGFRGEALASITHVARVQITSRTSNSACAFKSEFRDSKMLNGPKPCAGNNGTIVRAEDLFYNIPVRKQALGSSREEYTKIVDVVASYGILNAYKCSMTLKRIDDNTNAIPDVRIVAETSMDDCIVEIFGGNLVKQLLHIDHKDDKLAYSLSGRVSKSSYNGRKSHFILFINNRLVHCQLLKKAVECVYNNILPKHTFPFVFLHLELPSKNIDVNVHPTKYEVHFLHQELIITSIQQLLEKTVSSSSESRSFSTHSLLNTSISSRSDVSNTSLNRTPRTSEKIRIDPKLQKIKTFFKKVDVNESVLSSTGDENINIDAEPIKKVEVYSSKPDNNTTNVEKTPFVDNKEPIVTKESTSSSAPSQNLVSPKFFRNIELSTLKTIRDSIQSTNLCNWSNLRFVGVIDNNRILVQRDKDLLLLNTKIVNYNLFYQLCLHHFGNFGRIDLFHEDSKENITERSFLKDMLVYAIEEAGPLHQQIDLNTMIKTLVDNSTMLLDYFSFYINKESLTLETIPLLLENFVPDLRKLPKCLLNICTTIDWQDEESCLRGICREIAEFYSFGIGTNTSLTANKEEYALTFESVIMPMYRSFLRLPSSFEHDGTLVKLTSLPELYSVFERC